MEFPQAPQGWAGWGRVRADRDLLLQFIELMLARVPFEFTSDSVPDIVEVTVVADAVSQWVGECVTDWDCE